MNNPTSTHVTEAIDTVFRLVNREIWIVTSTDKDRRGGLVATWVSQASLECAVPMVLIGVAPHHFTAELISASGAFALHLITLEQIHLAWHFGIGSGRDRDKLADPAVPWSTGETGSPVLDDCLAWLDCRVITHYDAGDRVFFWADVVAGEQKDPTGRPLCEHDFFAATDEARLGQLQSNLHRDITRLGPLRDRWRSGQCKRP